MRQGYLSGLMVVLWMMTGKQDVTNNGGVSVRADILSQFVDYPLDDFIATIVGTDKALAPCDPPTGIAVGSITTTSASVSFTSAGTSFIVEYGPVGFTPGTGAIAGTNGTVVTGTASPIGLSGLTDGASYDVYVRNDCGVDGFSANTSVVSFSTACGAANVPYMERFDEPVAPAVPNCITVQNVNGGNTWRTVGTDFEVSYRNIMRIDWETDGVTPADDWFYTKGLNLNGGTSYRLRFQYRNSDAMVYTEKLEVKYGTAANAASMTLGTLFSNTAINNDVWQEADVDFTPASTGVYYIGFHGFSDADQAFLCVDNVNVILTPVCESPSNVLISNINSTLASVNFVSGGASFIVEYGAPGFTPGTGAGAGGGTVVTTNASPLGLTGLTPSTTYDVYVRRDCGGGSFSPNSLVVSFTTHLINDDAPGAISVAVDAACSGNIYTNLGATQSASEPYASCEGLQGHNTVWYKFVAPVGGAVRISNDFAGSGLGDSRLAVFSATDVNNYGTFTILGCDDDNGVVVADKSIVYLVGLTPGTTYYIQVDGHSSASEQGSFCLEVSTLTSSMIAAAASCGSSQGYSGLNTSYRGWISLVDNSGNLIANVKQTAGTATDIDANVNVNTLALRQDLASLQYYLDRNYKINAVGATNADVQFFFLNTEFTALQMADTTVALANLGVTRQTGSTCQPDFLSSNGTNSYLVQTGNGSVNGVNWVNATTAGFSNFYLHTSKANITLKTFLQGSYAGAGLHRAVTTVWRDVLRNNATSQPYNITEFGNYNGGENVSSLIFNNNTGTDIVDWVLLELRNAAPPAAPIARRAAFIREDGAIVDLDGVSPVSFRGIPTGSYYITIRHRNHLGIRTASLQGMDGALGSSAPLSYDFSTAQSQAFQNGSILTNAAMKDLGGGVFGLLAGNANRNNQSRANGGPTQNDYLFLVNTTLGGNTGIILSNIYHSADLNLDGVARASGGPTQNDYLILVNTIFGGNTGVIYTQHQ